MNIKKNVYDYAVSLKTQKNEQRGTRESVYPVSDIQV